MRKVLLGDICKPKQWKTISTSMLTEEGYSVYGANGVIGKYSEYNHKEETLLVTCRGATCGRLNICEPYSYVNGNAMALDDLDESVDIRYLYYVLKERGFKDVISGSAQPQIIRSALEKIPILIGTKAEQKEIVRKLALIDKCIEGRKSELRQLDELIKSRFVEMFGDPITNEMGWDKVRLSTCIESIDNGKSLVCDASARQGNWPAVLKLSAATYGFYRPEENKAMFDENQFVEDAAVRAGDLLFTRKNTPELVGMCAYVYDTPSRLMMPDLIFRLNTTNRCNKVFLWKLINHNLFRDCIQAIATGSAKSMSNISKERLLNLEIILPPAELQEQFAAFVVQTDKSKLFVNAYFILIFCCLRCIINTSVKSKLSNDKGEAL